MSKLPVATILASLGVLMIPSMASAAVTVSVRQVGFNVVATAIGTFDTTGLPPGVDRTHVNYLIPAQSVINLGSLGTGPNAPTQATSYTGLITPSNSMGSFLVNVGVGSGDVFDLTGNILYLTPGFMSGSSITSSLVFANKTLVQLGLNPGTYVFTAPKDTATVIVTAPSAPVPEPATWAMMLIGFGMVGFGLRSRRKPSARVTYT